MAPVQFLINILSISFSSLLIYYSKSNGMNSQVKELFETRKLSTYQQQADHLADIAYYYAIYILAISTVVTLIRIFRGQFNPALHSDTKFVNSLNQLIVKSTEYLLIFVSIYVYLLQQKGFGLKVNSLLLMPFWFLLGRVAALVQLLLTQLLQNKFVFSYFGFILTVFPYFAMIGQIFGYSPIKWF